MKRLSRDSWLAIGLFLLLIGLTVIAAIQQSKQAAAPPLASFSTEPGGARALWLWLDELGYTVSDNVPATFRLPQGADIILMLEPFAGITRDEWAELDTHVEEGGTLVLAGESTGAALAAYHYQFNLAYFSPPTTTLTTQNPLLVSPPVSPTRASPAAYWQTNRHDFVTHLAVDGRPVLVSFAHGDGQVILSATTFPFSNIGLKEAGNPALVLSLISAGNPAQGPGLVWFDEWHHGRRGTAATDVVGPVNWLRYTPTGRSLLYTAAIIFVALLLRGRRFGRPVPLPQDTVRRGPLEYITAIANLSRRAQHRAAVLRQYHHWLKRDLGQRYRLNPTLPDQEYLEQLAQFNPNLDINALRQLLAQLQRRNINESEMIQLAAEVSGWLKET